MESENQVYMTSISSCTFLVKNSMTLNSFSYCKDIVRDKLGRSDL